MEISQSLYEAVKARLKVWLVDRLNTQPNGDTATLPRKALREQLRQALQAIPLQQHRALQISRTGEEDRFLDEVIDEVIGTGPLQKWLDDATVSEIMVNGPEEIFVERNGCLARVPDRFRDVNHLRTFIEHLLDSVGLAVNESSPVCDASLADGSRVNVIIPPLVLNGPVLTIRRPLRDWSMGEYVTKGVLSQEAAQLLEACVKARVNLVVSGGTSTGKTTLVSILSMFIPAHERVITIENVAELKLLNRQHWVRLVSKAPNMEGRGEIPLRSLVRNALRMRPDRLILGEARAGEALDVVQAMHTGHEGVITVLHANSSPAALERLETLMLMSGLDLSPFACRTQIASAVDLIVHMGRFADGTRRIATITQVMGATHEGFVLEDLFTFEAEGFSSDGRLLGACRYTGTKPKFLSKLLLNNVEVPSWLIV